MAGSTHNGPLKRILERVVIIVWMTMLFSLLVDGQQQRLKTEKKQPRITDAAKMRLSTTIQPVTAVIQHENLCEFSDFMSPIICMCDSFDMQDAETAKCKVFNVTDQNDDIWKSFATQKKITELQLNVHEDCTLKFLPSEAFSHIPNVTSLQVLDADLESLAPNSFSLTVQLQILKLNRNKVTMKYFCL